MKHLIAILVFALGFSAQLAPAWATPMNADPAALPHGFNAPSPTPSFLAPIWLRSGGAPAFAADNRIVGDPYFALGTWGGDGRAIVHGVTDSSRRVAWTGPADDNGSGRAYAPAISGEYFGGINGPDDGGGYGDGGDYGAFDPSQLFGGGSLSSPDGLGSLGGSPASGGLLTGNGSSGGSGNGSDDNSGNGSGNGSGSDANNDPGHDSGHDGWHNSWNPWQHGWNNSGNGNGDGYGNSGNGGGLSAVPEPSSLAILLIALPAALLLSRRRVSRPQSWRIPALAALAIAFLFAPGRASAQLTDWETMCNGGQGVPPETVIMGCSQVLNTEGEGATNAAIAYNNRGNAFRAEARFAEAMDDYNAAIVLTPQDPFPYRNRGVTYGLLGNYAHALSDFDRAIALKPDYASAFLGRAFADAQLGDAARAAADFENAARLDPNLASAAGLPKPQAAQQARASATLFETAPPQR